jgi:anti-anti-sigma factor
MQLAVQKTRRSERTTVVTLAGEFDLIDVPYVEAQVADGRTAGERVILDTREVTFIDSSALALLLRLQRRADAEEWAIDHVTSEAVRSRVQRIGLDRVLRLRDEPPEASHP